MQLRKLLVSQQMKNRIDIDKEKECVACGNPESNRIFTAKERMFDLGHSFDYLECSACKSLQIIDIPENLDPYYPGDYYAFGGIVKSSAIKNIMKTIRWKSVSLGLFTSQAPEYTSWMKQLKAKKTDRIADIGCGNGQLLYELKCSGFKNLHGFDPYMATEVKEKGLELIRKAYHEIDMTFDIIMMHHSFEHMEFPMEVFKTIQKLVKKGGKVLIRVPVTDGEVWKKEGIYWFQLDAPRHFFIPSVAAMEQMAFKLGFQLKQVFFDSGGNQFWGPKLYRKGIKFSGTNLSLHFSAEDFERFEMEAKKLNEQKKGDQASFYFEKL